MDGQAPLLKNSVDVSRSAALASAQESLMKVARRRLSLALALFTLPIAHARAQSANAGRQQFTSSCAVCHGADGHGGPLGPNTNIVDIQDPRATSVEAVRSLIRSGVP